MAMDPIESLDHELKMAFVYGRIMLEHTQKMAELYHACVANRLTIHGEWSKASHVLKAVNPEYKSDFTVFWFTHGQVYVYFDQYGYSTYKTVDGVIKFVTTFQGNPLLHKDAFFKERLEAMKNLSGKIDQQIRSRIEILQHCNIPEMNRLGYKVSFDGSNMFDPVQGTRRVNGNTHHFYMFFDYTHDHTYKFLEFDSQNTLVNRVQCHRVATLFGRIVPQNTKTVQKSKSLPASKNSFWQRRNFYPTFR
jgi:hypothetical protein